MSNELANITSLIDIARTLNNADAKYKAALKVANEAFEAANEAYRVCAAALEANKVADAAFAADAVLRREAREAYDRASADAWYAKQDHKATEKAYETACGFVPQT